MAPPVPAAAPAPPTVEAAAARLVANVEGAWRLEQDPDIDPGRICRNYPPEAIARDHVRIVRAVEHPHWSQPSLTRETFATEADAHQHLEAWTDASDDGGLGIGHTKSWTRKVVTGAIVWELWAPCAAGETTFVALESALEETLTPTGMWSRCKCGGHCRREDPHQRKVLD